MEYRLKEYLKRQIDKVLDFVRDHTARKHGDSNSYFEAKAGENDSNVIINEQVKDAVISQNRIKQIWDNI